MKLNFLTALVLFCALPTLHAEDSSRPNVLFIISDDLTTRLGCYGDEQVLSPNIDSLAARGVRFESAYCQYPLCGPSRNSMLCGLYPDSTGIIRNAEIFRDTIPDRISLPQAFRQSGYLAARVGKLYHYHVPFSVGSNGHDDPESWEIEINPAGCDRLIEQPDTFTLRKGSFGGTLSWYASPRPDEQHTDGMMAEDASWVLERCAKTKRPFFLAVGFYRPHTPYVAPAKYFEHYPLDAMPVPDDVESDVADLPPAALLSHKRDHELLTDDLRRQAIQAYYASTTFMDAQVGKVLNTLRETGLDQNTIVVFTSDHGYHLGAKGLWQKMSLFEESAGVPMIVALPKSDPRAKQGGSVCESPVGLIDLYPTLVDLCDVEVSQKLHGQSLAPMLADASELGRGYTISQVTRGGKSNAFDGYTIRDSRYHLTLWDDGKKGVELYDHQNDPLEKINLAVRRDNPKQRTDDPEVLDVIKDLTGKLNAERTKAMPATGRPPVQRLPRIPFLVSP